LSILTSEDSVVVPMAASGAISEIPQTPGVYAYYVSFLSRRSLGLFQGKSASTQAIASAKVILSKKFKRYLALRKERVYGGWVRDSTRHSHLAPFFSVELEEHFSEAPLEALLSMEDERFLSALDLLESTFILQSPVYVGITQGQTLRERCIQHKADFESDVNGKGFGSRLKKLGFDWSDLIYVASPSCAFGAELKEVEKAIHVLVNPILSLR